jgi:hypothetical protein
MDILEKYETIYEINSFLELNINQLDIIKIKKILNHIDLDNIIYDNFIEYAKHTDNNFKAILDKLENSQNVTESIIEIATNKSNYFQINSIFKDHDRRLTNEEYLFCFLNHSPKFKFLIGYCLNLKETIDLYLFLLKNIKNFNKSKFILFINFVEYLNEDEYNGLYSSIYNKIKIKCLN